MSIRRVSCAPAAEQPPRRGDLAGEAVDLRPRHVVPETRQTVVAAPLVVAGAAGATGRGPLVELFDQALIEETRERAIERAGVQDDRALGAALDVLHDLVAVPL